MKVVAAKKILSSRLFAIAPLAVFTTSAFAAESIDYVAEHLLEVPMDARYQAFPQSPEDLSQAETRLQLGYAECGGSRMQNAVPMFSLQYYYPLKGRWSLLLGTFWDKYQISGNRGSAFAEPIYGDVPQLPKSFNVNMTAVTGDGSHYGVSFAVNYHYRDNLNLQLGLALERLDVDRFRVEFDTVDLENNFSGTLDYQAAYNIVTPYTALEWQPGFIIRHNIASRFRVLFALPLPRVGFIGRVSGPDFDVEGDAKAAGYGAHIPDPYLAIGYTLEHKSSGWRVDIAAPLYTRLYEPVAHREIDNPLTVSFSLPL